MSSINSIQLKCFSSVAANDDSNSKTVWIILLWLSSRRVVVRCNANNVNRTSRLSWKVLFLDENVSVPSAVAFSSFYFFFVSGALSFCSRDSFRTPISSKKKKMNRKKKKTKEMSRVSNSVQSKNVFPLFRQVSANEMWFFVVIFFMFALIQFRFFSRVFFQRSWQWQWQWQWQLFEWNILVAIRHSLWMVD